MGRTIVNNHDKKTLDLPPKPPVPFEFAPYELDFGLGFVRFRIGTCEGLWRSTKYAYEILAVVNNDPGNGHFKYVLGWFERSAIRDNKKIRFCEVMNKKFRKHLKGLGFKKSIHNGMEKSYK